MTENEKRDNDKDLELEDVFNSKSDDTIDKKKLIKKQKDRKIVPYVLAVGSLFLILGVGALTYKTFTSAKVDKTSQTNKNSGKTKPTKEKPDKDLYQDDKSPVKLEPWQKVPYEDQVKSDKSKLKNSVISWVDNTALANVTNLLPSEANGYTSDISKATNEDGTPNLKYAYQTKETLDYNLGTALNKILNPVFGSWASMPVGDAANVKKTFPGFAFIPMFTKEWVDANTTEEDFSKMPVFADWAGDSYGGLKFNEKDQSIGRWYGELKKISGYSEPMEDNSGVKVTADADVEFTATLEGGQITKRTGQLHLVMVPNHDNVEDPDYRNLISEATLTMN